MPIADGRKLTERAQVAPGAMKAAVQVSLSMKSVTTAWVPTGALLLVMAMLETRRAALPVFVTVIVCATPNAPTGWVAKVRVEGLRTTAGRSMVVAVSSGICQRPRP